MLTPQFLREKFDAAHTYEGYLATATPQQLEKWRAFEPRVTLTDAQRSLIGSFVRPMPVLVTSGTWCGDCVAQVPMLRAIELANPDTITLRILDRDEHKDLSEQIKICDGLRVPTVLFLNECFDLVSMLGDRTLSRYRALAARQLGGACPLPGAPVPDDEVAATLADWIDEFERVQLLLRLSPKLLELQAG